METSDLLTIETRDAAVIRTAPPFLIADAEIAVGTAIGRYIVSERLGAGAMGVVLGADDPELERKVAIKLLETHARDRPAAQARLAREAQALAKLAHPNVVAIYDVGVHRDRLFVAMEHVDGQTLGHWLAAADQARPWPEVLTYFMEAGRGLAAAHAVGLVHRDFKPDNVMLGRDGRVRVLDFGLARVEADAAMLDTTADEGAEATPELTQAGALLGTPAYMAPEQLRRKPADARSDQFAFCVALYEGLYGARPFSGSSIAAVLEAIESGQLQPPPPGAAVPPWLRRALVRGLAADPEQRYASLDELLAALAKDPRLGRRKRGLALAFAGALGFGGWGVLVALRPEPAPAEASVCEGMDAKLAGVWDEDRRKAVRAAMLGTGTTLAKSTWTRVEARLDTYAEAWVSTRSEACQATARGEQSDALLDLRMICLDRRLTQLDEAVAILSQPDPKLLGRAVELLARLPKLDRCSDAAALEAEQPPPEAPELAAAVTELRERLDRAETVGYSGRYPKALAAVSAVADAAETTEYPPLVVRARLLQGNLEARSGNYEPSVETLEETYLAALAARMPQEGAHAAASLVRIHGSVLGDPPTAAGWTKHAKAVAEASNDAEATASVFNSIGLVAQATHDGAGAAEAFGRALELLVESEADELALTPPLHNLASIAAARGDWDEAEAKDERVCAIIERELGEVHPALLPCSLGLAAVARERGELDQARAHIERAIAVTEGALGPEHPRLAGPLRKLGALLLELGELDAAVAAYERSTAVTEAKFGPTHASLASSLTGLGEALLARGDATRAAGILERALTIHDAAGELVRPEARDQTRALLDQARAGAD